MATPNPRLLRIGLWLRNKRNFYVYSVITVGIPSWLGLVWLTWGYSNNPVGWILFSVVLGFGASLVWAFVMWQFFGHYFGTKRTGANNDNA